MNNKKLIISFSFITILFVLIINMIFVRQNNLYKQNYNNKINEIVYKITLDYKDITKKEIMEILNGFLNTDKEKIKMAQTFNCSKLQLLTKIIIPANVTTFINSLKINIGLSLVGVITGEFLVSKAGLRILNSLWRSSI